MKGRPSHLSLLFSEWLRGQPGDGGKEWAGRRHMYSAVWRRCLPVSSTLARKPREARSQDVPVLAATSLASSTVLGSLAPCVLQLEIQA